MESNLPELQAPIDKRIANALIAATPDWWDQAVLEIDVAITGDSEKMSHTIWSPEGHPDIIAPTEDLMDGTHALAELFRTQGKMWRRAQYKVALEDDGSWIYKAEFGY